MVKLLSEDNQTVCASVAAKSKPLNDDSSTDEDLDKDESPWIKTGKNIAKRRKQKENFTLNLDSCLKNKNKYNKLNRPSGETKNYHQTDGQKSVIVIGDSMTKLITGRKLSKSSNVTTKSFPGATIEDLKHYSKPTLKFKPDKIIIHAGTNNLKKATPKQIKTKLAKAIQGIKQEHPSVEIAVSSVFRRNDAKSSDEKKVMDGKILEVNKLLRNLCDEHNFDFINNDNINDNCLNTGGLHLNPKGIYTFASNLRNYIKY